MPALRGIPLYARLIRRPRLRRDPPPADQWRQAVAATAKLRPESLTRTPKVRHLRGRVVGRRPKHLGENRVYSSVSSPPGPSRATAGVPSEPPWFCMKRRSEV